MMALEDAMAGSSFKFNIISQFLLLLNVCLVNKYIHQHWRKKCRFGLKAADFTTSTAHGIFQPSNLTNRTKEEESWHKSHANPSWI